MDGMTEALLAQFRTALSPFLLLTSCATLVWSLQARYSRVVLRIRTVAAKEGGDNDRRRRILKRLRHRAWMLRNSVAAHYMAMMCFLLTVVLLSLTTLTPLELPGLSVGCFITGLILICIALLNTTWEVFGSIRLLEEEFGRGDS
jgi:hypothetical protein